MVVHRNWVVGFLVLFFSAGCSKELPKATESIRKRPEPVQIISYNRGEQDTDSHPIWYEVSAEGCKTISDPANSQVLPFAPWTMASRLIGFVASESFAVAGLNRDGFMLFEESPGGDLALYRIVGNEKVSPFSALAILLLPQSELDLGLEKPMPALLVARDPYFSQFATDPVSPVPAEPLVVLNLRDCSLLNTRPRAFGFFGTNIEALDRGIEGNWYIKAAQFGEGGQHTTDQGGVAGKQYFSAPTLMDEAVSIDRGTYQATLTPKPFTTMPKLVQSLMGAFTDSQRKDHFPVLQLVQSDRPIQEIFMADPAVKNGPPLSGGESEIIKFLGFSDGKRAVVVLKDGRGVIRHSKIEAFNLPPLAEGFVYTGIVMLPHWIIASWEEQESFVVGSAGFLVLPL